MCIPRIVARQRLDKKDYRGNEYTPSNLPIVGSVAFYMVLVVLKESKVSVLPRASC
jgi:hypothetical protein